MTPTPIEDGNDIWYENDTSDTRQRRCLLIVDGMGRPRRHNSLFLLLLSTLTLAQAPLKGDVTAVFDLLDRVLPPGGKEHFSLQVGACLDIEPPCFCLQDETNGKLKVTATSVSELSAGIGHYLRQFANMTIGWPRGGGSNVFIPTVWPTVGQNPVCKRRIVPWSYLMNVCTHSYSLVWYDWSHWEQFIDWMSLSGVNMMLALTGQEEVQYKVFSKLGLSDIDIRSWFNGPAFLTWSRGQNEYGNNICGPLPRSWMQDQWEMQRNLILPRLRSLGITGQLPGFQGNVPIQLKELYNDTNITQEGDTGWMDSLDPFFGTIADLFMETLIQDFGTDHWYQLDGYFDGSTAPWLSKGRPVSTNKLKSARAEANPLVWHSELPHDIMAYRRGEAAYMGLNRTDPNAIWSFQGWAVIGWSTTEQAAFLKGFVDSTPTGKFVVIDMSPNGSGQWKQWNNASFFGAPFVWTTVNNFGGTDGMKGDLSVVNKIPFDGISTSVIGMGATPEGIDQNPAYYEFVFNHNFRDGPLENLRSHMIERGHKRYGLLGHNRKVADAWSLLSDSAYAQDLSVQDLTGLSHLPPPHGDDMSLFERNRYEPKPVLCKIFVAWELLLQAAEETSTPGFREEPFIYDLINLGREVLAQLATPASLNFTESAEKLTIDKNEIKKAGTFYVGLLRDVDALVATDAAFLLGPWIESARLWGKYRDDCPSAILDTSDCEHFYEWNCRTQLTTWNPTPNHSAYVPGGPVDYAAKHWSGLIKDYYGGRATLLLRQALKCANAGTELNQTRLARLFAQHAYKWTTDTKKYPIASIGCPLEVSRTMYNKYKHWFSTCGFMSGLNYLKEEGIAFGVLK